MTKTTLYALGIFITLLLGTHFFQRLCSDCRATQKSVSIQEIVPLTEPEGTSHSSTVLDKDLGYPVKDMFNFNDSAVSALLTEFEIMEHKHTGLILFPEENTQRSLILFANPETIKSIKKKNNEIK